MGVTSRTGIVSIIYKEGDKKYFQLQTHILQFLRINCKKKIDTMIIENQSDATKKSKITLHTLFTIPNVIDVLNKVNKNL